MGAGVCGVCEGDPVKGWSLIKKKIMTPAPALAPKFSGRAGKTLSPALWPRPPILCAVTSPGLHPPDGAAARRHPGGGDAGNPGDEPSNETKRAQLRRTAIADRRRSAAKRRRHGPYEAAQERDQRTLPLGANLTSRPQPTRCRPVGAHASSGHASSSARARPSAASKEDEVRASQAGHR